MTSPEGRQVPSTASTDQNTPPPVERKAVLFCPDCGHEDLTDGDWVERDDHTDRVRELCCPVCDAVVTGRPLPRDSEATTTRDRSSLGPRFGSWRTIWVATLRFWFNWQRNTDGLGRAN